MVLAHEYGHAIQHQAGITDHQTPVLVSEQQADCLAGVYMRWVAEGNSPRFTLSTSDGLNNLLAAMIAFRDPLLERGDPEADGDRTVRRSSGSRRSSSASRTAPRRAPRSMSRRSSSVAAICRSCCSGTRPASSTITEDSVRDIVNAMGVVFTPDNPPRAGLRRSRSGQLPGLAQRRPRRRTARRPTRSSIDLPALQDLGARPEDGERGLASGDNTAYSVVVSRYMMALQNERGVMLDTAVAALRTACLTGVATAAMTSQITTPDGNTIAITAGDVDEAVSGILVNGYVASDVNGETVPSGFSRIDAFRIGVLGDEDRCFKRFA